MKGTSIILTSLAYLLSHSANAFTVTVQNAANTRTTALRMSEMNSLIDGVEDAELSPVKKLIIKEGDGEIPTKGSKVEIEYAGTLGESQTSWSVEDVAESWLKHQQGLYDVLLEPFKQKEVNGQVLLDPDVFNEQFVAEELEITNRIQCKKTVMAAKRLAKQIDEFPEGLEFDSSISRGKSYEFVLGSGKVIKAMDLLVATMKVGEKAQVICRSDYGYGNEGYRKSTGEIVVPPFATLSFHITLLSIN